MEVSEGALEEEREESPMDHSAPPPAPPPQSHVHAADPRHYWGRGNVMEGEGQPDEGILKHKGKATSFINFCMNMDPVMLFFLAHFMFCSFITIHHK